jgi:hypothetical protein
MRHGKLIWFCIVAAGFAVLIELWGREASKPLRRMPLEHFAVSVGFQGYSNSVSGERWGLLMITNSDRGDLNFSGPYMVQRGAGELAPGEALEVVADWREAQWKCPAVLPVGSSCAVAVEVPPGTESWRTQCLLARTTWTDRLLTRLPRWWPSGFVPLRSQVRLGRLITEWTPQGTRSPNGK